MRRTDRARLCTLLSLLLLLMPCSLLTACTEGDLGEGAVTDTDTVTDTSTETDGADTLDTLSGTEPENGSAWTPDTGVFNEGKVAYRKEVETTPLLTYGDADIGACMMRGAADVDTLFYTDFSDNDPTAANTAALYQAGQATVKDGKLWLPYDATTESGFSGGWTLWSPVPAADWAHHKQVQLSLTWDITSVTEQAWMTPFVGCYVTHYTNKLPTEPGDGLWFAFNEMSNSIAVYHPDTACWPGAWAQVPVTAGLMSGQHKLDIVCTPAYDTYIYITPAEGGDAQLVCTVSFDGGKIAVRDGAGNLIREDACTTEALGGENFSVFPHASGAVIDEAAVLGAWKGGSVERTVVTATPDEGHELGLDITDKTDLVSICYSVWFDTILGGGSSEIDSFNNITEALAGNQGFGNLGEFHYWAKPAEGYYRSSDKSVIRTHMRQLYTAGVDFIIVDLTNAHNGYLGSSAWITYIQQPVDAICETIMEMRAEGEGTPYVVFWVGNWVGDSTEVYKAIYDRYYTTDKWRDCFVYWDDKPFLLTSHLMPSRFPYKNLFTVRCMWGLGVNHKAGQWSFLSVDNKNTVTYDKDGNPEQLGVATASQETYMSASTAHGRDGGAFWNAQWQTAFDVHPKIVTLTWWNEWVAQRIEVDGKVYFTDNYTQEYSRDIEPMEGGHGDQYYQWLIQYIAAYKGGLACPDLVDK